MATHGVIFVLVRNNEILMQQRDKNSTTCPFMWCLPGGGSEEGEDFETTLIREVQEEYAIDLSLDQCRYLMDYNNGRVNKVYICNLTQTQDPELHEGLAMKWMTIEEIEKITLAFNQEGIIPVLKKSLLG
jgi:8-oxo-dGTP pyrophosphatase MutT (NUDIX family)